MNTINVYYLLEISSFGIDKAPAADTATLKNRCSLMLWLMNQNFTGVLFKKAPHVPKPVQCLWTLPLSLSPWLLHEGLKKNPMKCHFEITLYGTFWHLLIFSFYNVFTFKILVICYSTIYLTIINREFTATESARYIDLCETLSVLTEISSVV